MTPSQQPALNASEQATSTGPIVKWAGGKAHLLPELVKRVPPHARYFEPFAGGAALFFALRPRRAVLNDANADLIVTYRAVATRPLDVLAWLAFHDSEHRLQNPGAHYRAARARWNANRYPSAETRAAAFLYLNRVCFNGLWRVNRAGEFNVSMGAYKNPTICNRDAILAASAALQGVELRCGDYRLGCADADAGDFVYFDPPYDGCGFDYHADGFGAEQQRDLADAARDLIRRGVHVLLSNADTSLVRTLYADFDLHVVQRPGTMNSDPTKRSKVDELVIVGRTAGRP